MTRTERAESQSVPVSLFGDDGGGDYNAGWLADGAYTLKATPYSESLLVREAMRFRRGRCRSR